MKNQGVWITKILSLVLCAFVFLYMGYHLVGLIDEPLKTTTAVLFTTSHVQQTDGVVVRDEYIFPLPPGLVEFRAGEAERVSKGQELVFIYVSASAMEDSRKLAQSLEKRELLAYIETHSSGISEPGMIDDQIRAKISSVLAMLDGGVPAGVKQSCIDLKTLLFRQSYSFGGKAELSPIIARLDDDIARLSGSLSSVTTTLRADRPGLFSARSDGLEDVWTPSAVKNITVEGFRELSSVASPLPSEDSARLVTDWTWQYACLMPAASAYSLAQTAEVRFEDGRSFLLEKISVSPEDSGMCAVVFGSAKYISSVIGARKTRAEIVFADYTGIRVPREGLRIDENGRRYVYCLVLGSVVRKDVTIYDQIDRENYYLAVYDPKGGGLLPGDEIIVSGRDIYDGRIFR